MLRRRLVFITLLLAVALALSGVSVTVKAAPTADTAVRYMPADTWLYASMRVDDDFITTLDGLINKIGEVVTLTGGSPIPPSPLRTVLTLALAQARLNLQTDIRPWLGQRIAFGLGNPALIGRTTSPEAEDVPAVLALDITDQAAADAFVTRLLGMANLEQSFRRTEGSEFISYDSQMLALQIGQQPVSILITSDALLIGTQVGLAAARGDGTALAEAPRFAETLRLMPADSYNLLFYFDANAVFSEAFAVAQQSGMIRQMEASLAQMQQMFGAVGGMIIGATILDDRSLTLDVAQQVLDAEALVGSADAMSAFSTPVDPLFLALLPANTVAVSQGTNLAGLYDQMLLAMQSQQAMMDPGMSERFERQMEQALGEFQAATGLDLNADVLAWMTGDAAVFVGYDAPAAGSPSALWSMVTNDEPAAQNFDFGVMVEATDDPEAASTVVDRLGATMEERLQKRPAPRVSIVREPVGGADAVVIRMDLPGLDAPFDLVLASNDQVMVFATRPAAEVILSSEAILSGAGGFAQKPAFVEAQQYILPGTVQLHYVDTGLLDLFADFAALSVVDDDEAALDDVLEHIFEGRPLERLPEPDQASLAETRREYDRTITLARQVTDVISSATISSVLTPEMNSVSRVVLTLGE